MALLTKDQILGAQDYQVQDVEVPEWGGTVRVCTLTAMDRDRLQHLIVDQLTGKPKLENLATFKISLCACAIVDESGARIFSDEDVEALGRKSAVALDRVFTAADKLNAISAGAAEAVKKS